MNFIDEEQPFFYFKSLFYCKTFECKAYQLNEKNPDKKLTLLRISSIDGGRLDKKGTETG